MVLYAGPRAVQHEPEEEHSAVVGEQELLQVSAFHEELARSRQADFLREADAARLAAEARQNHQARQDDHGLSWRESLSGLTAYVSRRRTKASRLVVRPAH